MQAVGTSGETRGGIRAYLCGRRTRAQDKVRTDAEVMTEVGRGAEAGTARCGWASEEGWCDRSGAGIQGRGRWNQWKELTMEGFERRAEHLLSRQWK